MTDNQPRMQAIADQLTQAISGLTPHLVVRCDDNLMSNVTLRGSLDPKDAWTNGIWENSRYFRFDIEPAKGQRYYAGGEVEVALEQSYGVPKFRRSTTTPEKAIERIVKWIKDAKQS